MLELTVKMSESYNEETEEFIMNNVTLELEHSLLSVSKWESEYKKPFLVPGEKTEEEVLGYIKCMIITPVYPPEVLQKLAVDSENLKKIHEYISEEKTGSSVPDEKNAPRSRERITSELIYYWMTKYRIPWEAQTWHLSRLFMLIKIFGVKDAPAKKRTPAELAAERKAENARRKAMYNTKG